MQITFHLQPILENEQVLLRTLKENDFDALYLVASDPLVWEQHPNKDRYQKEVFLNFFQGAMESGGAFLITDHEESIGCSRYYDWNAEERSIAIGYTFFGRKWWGGTHNRAVKTLMLDHAFQFAGKVFFYIGKVNIRSQKAIEKLGAQKIREEEIAYYGEKSNPNCIYEMTRERWEEIRRGWRQNQ